VPRRAGAAAGAQVIQGLDWVRQNYEAPATVVMALGGEAQYALDLAVHDLARVFFLAEFCSEGICQCIECERCL